MLINFGDREFEYDPAAIDVRTAMTIRDHTGLGMKSWEKAIDDADPTALQALYWAVLCQNGERPPIKSLNFSVLEFYNAIVEASTREIAEKLATKAQELAAEADPTVTAA